MEKKLSKKTYMISRIIIAIFTFSLFLIMYINEELAFKVVALIFGVIAFGISFPSTIISKKIIAIGNKTKYKLLYYIIILPIITIVLIAITYFVFLQAVDFIPEAEGLGEAISQALTALFILIVVILCIVIPYIQSLLVLILKKFIKE